MGTSQSQNPLWHSTNPEFELSDQNLTFLKTKKDIRIGDIDEFEHIPTKKKLLRKEILIEDPTQLTSDNLEKLKARVHLRHKNILESYGFALETSTEGPAKLRLFFEPFLSDAGAAFDQQQKKQQFFAEAELLASLKSTAEALAHLQKHNISHGHITPKAILMSQEGDIKIIDHSLIENEHSAYAASLQGAQTSYLAPELFRRLGNERDIPSDFNPFKADVYSLGMAFLHGALLEEPKDCYVWSTHYFDFIKLMDRLDRVRAKYPGRFANVLSLLLKVDIQQRPDAENLLLSLESEQRTQIIHKKQAYSISEKPKVELITAKAEKFVPKHVESLKTSQTVTPRKEFQGLSTKKYTFVDPKVQEIIRESRQKKWIKSNLASSRKESSEAKEWIKSHLASSRKGSSEAKERIPSYSPTGLRYANAFLQEPIAYVAKNSNLTTARVVQTEAEEGEFDPNKFLFNKPKVNEIIATIIRSRSKSPEKKLDYTILYTQYIESPVREKVSEEKLFMSPGYVKHTETPEKKAYLIEDLAKSYVGSDAKDNKVQSLAATFYSYQKKSRAKEEVIQELREKYGTRINVLNAQIKQKNVQGEEELALDQKEVKNVQEIEA